MKLIVKSLLFAGLMIFGFNVSAQSVADAGNMFNRGNQQFKTKAYGQAVKLYQEALKTAKAVGPDAFNLQGKIESQLAKSYFWNGISFYQKRQFDEAIAQLQKSRKMAETIQNANIKSLAVTYISRVYSSKGNMFLQQKKYAEADAQYNAALKVKPNSINAYLGKSFLAKDQKNMDLMVAMVAKVGKLVNTNSKGSQLYVTAKRMAFGTLLNAGATELQNANTQKALVDFTMAIKFNSRNSSLYYYMAIANLRLKKWDAAISNARKALTLERNGKSDTYFILGQAYQGKGFKTSACNAFKNVVKGPNVAAAKYQRIHVLKCK